jgi:hypothetical protein
MNFLCIPLNILQNLLKLDNVIIIIIIIIITISSSSSSSSSSSTYYFFAVKICISFYPLQIMVCQYSGAGRS